MISPFDIADKIDDIVKRGRGCLCSLRESCENCRSGSQLNQLRNELRKYTAELRGEPIKEPTLEDYGRSFEVDMDDMDDESAKAFTATIENMVAKLAELRHSAEDQAFWWRPTIVCTNTGRRSATS